KSTQQVRTQGPIRHADCRQRKLADFLCTGGIIQGLISEAHQAIIRLSPSLWITSVRALINLTDNLAIRRDKTGQHSLRRATDAINHVTAHCSRLVAQIVCCAAHRTALFSVLPGKPVALLTCRSTNQLALCAWLLVHNAYTLTG